MDKISIASKQGFQPSVRGDDYILFCLKLLYPCSVKEADVEQLFVDKELLGKELTRITLSFVVKGQDEGTYSAHITSNEDGFRVDAVYRETNIENKAKLDIALPGR